MSQLPSNTSSRASSRKNRVYAFREFLLATYGGVLQPGATIMDVAGGKGDLSWLLNNVDGINSIIADPRVPDHSHLIKSVQYLLSHPTETESRAIPGLPTHQPLATLVPKIESGKPAGFQTPRHLRIFVDATLVDAVRYALLSTDNDKGTYLSSWESCWVKASARAETATPLGYRQKSTQNSESGRIFDAAIGLSAIRSSQLIVGFHPDQATEACIDLALLLRVPFVICPCCVFPSEFPERRLHNGSRVRTYDDFIQYLLGKHESIRVEELNFHQTNTARNLVLYLLPEDL